MTEKKNKETYHRIQAASGKFLNPGLPECKQAMLPLPSEMLLHSAVGFRGIKPYSSYRIKSFLLSVILVFPVCFPFYSPNLWPSLGASNLPLMQISLRLVTSKPPHCVGRRLQGLYFAQWHCNQHSSLIWGRNKCWDTARSIFLHVNPFSSKVN